MEYKSTKEEKFDSIYRAYVKDVYRACLHTARNDVLAEEMTQQAFVNFYERFETVKPECAKAYLIRSARNLLYNFYRDTKKEWIPSEEEKEAALNELIGDNVEEQYFEMLRQIKLSKLKNVILADLRQHNESWYEIISMIFVMEMSHDEVAEKLNITKDVLYSKLHRAKIWIQKNYKDDFDKINMA